MSSLVKKTLILSSLMMLELADAAIPETIAVWPSRNDGAYVVYTSELYKDGWTTPAIAAKSDNRIIAAAVGSASLIAAAKDMDPTARGLITVWTEVVAGQWLLKFATRDADKWTAPKLLTTLTGENLAPTIVHDLRGNPWIFWSSNATGNDDIYLTRRINGSWGETEMVNLPNQFPDMVPNTHISDNGDVVVEWDTLDTKANRFVKSKRVYPNNTGVGTKTKSSEEVTTLNAPESARTTARINLHYPANKFMQSEFVQAGFPPQAR
jgi:hypothetical protein